MKNRFHSDTGLSVYDTENPHLLDFELPEELEAGEPPEARGISRDQVKLMVSYIQNNHIEHTIFRDFPKFLEPGDILVINTSGTMNATLPVIHNDGLPLELHLSTRLPGAKWIVELRQFRGSSTVPFYDASPGEVFELPQGASMAILNPYANPSSDDSYARRHRLWLASLHIPGSQDGIDSTHNYLSRNGSPIRYAYVQEEWPLDFYQTVYFTEIGSAEMPSAGRAFTPEIITQLVARGIVVVPLLLHTGVASLEEHEPPYEEYYQVPENSARIINLARKHRQRIIAIGTTVVRALESVTDAHGVTQGSSGWTNILITPERGIRSVDGLLTGLHEPRASHLFMLEALAGKEHLHITYREALEKRYLWHEFGDLHLILP